MPLKRCFSALLALALTLCLCACGEDPADDYIGSYTSYDSSLPVDGTLYGLFRHAYLNQDRSNDLQFELVTLADGEATSLTFFPTGVTMRFHPAGNQLLCVKDGRLLAYTLPERETKTICEVGEGATIFCVTENFVLLDNGTMVDLRTAEVLPSENLPANAYVKDVAGDCVYYWHHSTDSACRYDCSTDTVTTLYDRERNPSVSHRVGIAWNGRYLYCEDRGLYAVPLDGAGEPELAIEKPTRILAMARGGDDLYLAADTLIDRIGFYRLTPDGTVTELAVWEELEYYGSVELMVSDGELVCVNPPIHGGATPPEVFRLPLAAD